MRILGIIPARGGSKGVPGKNIKLLNGKPLLHYTAEVARECRLLENVIVSTEDPKIAVSAQSIGIDVPFMRPEHLAQDNTATVDVIKHVVEWYSERDIQFDAVCLLQPTCPFRNVEFLNDAILKFQASGCDSLISVRKVPHEFNPHWTFEKTANGNLRIATGETMIIPRRQELPDAYHRDGSIYITKSDVILKQGSVLGETITFIESTLPHVNIDTPADWDKAEQLAKRLFN